MRRISLIILVALLGLPVMAQSSRTYIKLAGKWQFKAILDDKKAELPDNLKGTVLLPGTLDTNHKGYPLEKKDETAHLSRLYSYTGKVQYSREVYISDVWRGKSILLHLERTKPTEVFFNGKSVGTCTDISTEQVYDVTKYVRFDRDNKLSIIVDNSSDAVPPQIISNSHAYTDDTQTNWNGIIGQMYLEAVNPLHISSLKVMPEATTNEVQVSLHVTGELKRDASIRFLVFPWGERFGYIVAQGKIKRDNLNERRLRFKYINDSIFKWDEFHPYFYTLKAEIVGHDEESTTFGVRDFKTDSTHFIINGRPTFLRGKHDACVFPYTGHVPMNMEEWRRYFQICKGYGINHVRFHSWCPPESCFLAADIEGIYLQPELPFWGDFKREDDRLINFLFKEGINILTEYGHHPSFVMFSLGNELWGDIPAMKKFVDEYRKIAPDKLYTFGSNYYLGYKGVSDGMDFFVTCRNGGEVWGEYNTHTRGSFSFADAFDGGMLNHFYPNSSMTLDEGCSGSTVPVISHETGQFQTYPDFNEISKYKGVLYPYNLEVFRSRLEKAGMLNQAEAFHRASGAWSTLLYKADIELDLRTKSMAGFQLLDLQDYPGQGSAYVGILDAFMEPKGLITPAEWRNFCSPIVPLFATDKFCYSSSEQISGKLMLSNYGSNEGTQKWDDGRMRWQLRTEDGTVLRQGETSIPEECAGLTIIDSISVDVSDIKTATRLNFVLQACLNKQNPELLTNSWPIWVYPADNNVAVLETGITITSKLTDEIAEKLQNGEKVLFMPDTTQLRNLTVGPLFQTDYWNYRMFKTISENNSKPVSPGTLGILTDPKHPLFASFPTEEHTNWQWFPIIKASRPFILDNMPQEYLPTVQVIDNIERNHKLGIIFEMTVGEGKLLVCMSDLRSVQQYPEARQLYMSILQYMHSRQFSPKARMTMEDLNHLFTAEVKEGQIGKLSNISFE